MDPADNGKAEATYTSSNGRVRAYYRTVMTAEDDFKRRFLESGFMVDGGGTAVNGELLARFCLDRFCNRVELLDENGAVTAAHSYTPDLLGKLTDVYAEGGWTLDLSLLIYRQVLKRKVESVDALKKTSLTPSAPSSSEPRLPENKPEQPSIST